MTSSEQTGRTPADVVIEALRTGHDRLVSLVSSLTPEQLTGPSAASEWTVAEVLSHLGSGAEINAAVLQTAASGDAGAGGVQTQVIWDRWNAMEPARQAEQVVFANQDLVRRLEGLDAAARADLRIDVGWLPEPVDVATFAGLRLNEFALHSWDVRSALDPTAILAPEAVAILLSASAPLIGFIGKAEALAHRPVTVAIETTEPDRRLGLSIADRVTLTDAPASPDATASMPAESWLRLTSGRLPPDRTRAEVTVSGSVTLDDLRRVFPGF